MAVQRLTVGIFSRDGPDNYKWLVNVLRMPMFQNVVEYVLNVYITNNFRSFTDALTQCSFAILYHTKNRGRLNIANVTDSLYDEELKELNHHLGDNVVVLVDDLDNSNDDNKRKILNEQPLIDECARELILISKMEKQAANLNGSDPRLSPPPNSHAMQDAYDSIYNKIYRIRTFLEDAVGVHPDDRSRNDSYRNSRAPNDSDSDTQSEGYRSSITTKSARYSHQGVDSVRSSSAYSSDRSSRPLFNSQRFSQRDGNAAQHEEAHISLHNDGNFPDGDQSNNKRRSRGGFLSCFKNISDKMVFFLIGGGAFILLIILIIILCVVL
ncbi:uncharacterized protein [Pyxicephalus adspersus]|uniref:uncharacterized protein n=1 Tax=Pyxicephalus adspersus TaxID=30357 RepID=UPI003B5A22C6